MGYSAGEYDVIVIGAGHAGIEAALSAARLCMRTLCVTLSLDGVGNMPCNPSIGGTAKGQLVREIDALGGEMGRAADATGIQFRMLNSGKGPAVYSPRAQSDRAAYRDYMRQVLENCDNLSILQGECCDILLRDGVVCGIEVFGGGVYSCKAVVLATGTFLNSRTLTGEVIRAMGPDGMMASTNLSPRLAALGITLRRFKTGTPARISRRSVDFSQLSVQYGDDDFHGFCFPGGAPKSENIPCYLTYTNEKTHEIIRGSLSRSPLYTGVIEGIGPRYCPSIEDKVVRFADKPRHQVFLEPCGRASGEIYLQGLSSSLPEDVQLAFIHSITGLEHALITRPGYAIEYDCFDPTELSSALMLRKIPGLFAAGQLCGSSGYEEAAGQGLIAGINAVRFCKGKPPFTLKRSDGYIGTLIDDLVTRGTNEPYRMMTSRSEYRLVCRQDNADRRLMGYGAELGLVSRQRLEQMEDIYSAVSLEIARLRKTGVPPSEKVNSLLESAGTDGVTDGASLLELLRRPQLSYSALAPIDQNRPALSPRVIEQVEINIKYEGYIRRQMTEIEEQKRMENRVLPPDIDYGSINLLRIEARQKLAKIMPETLGQAARISGVSPADIGALIVWLSQKEGKHGF